MKITLDTNILISATFWNGASAKIIDKIEAKKVDLVLSGEIVEDDPDDNKIIECAVEGDVDYVISYNKHLLKLKEFKGIKIVKPEEFLRI